MINSKDHGMTSFLAIFRHDHLSLNLSRSSTDQGRASFKLKSAQFQRDSYSAINSIDHGR